MNKHQKEEVEEVRLESTTEDHLCNTGTVTKPQTSTKQLGDEPHKPKQEAKSALRGKGPSKHSLPHADRSTAAPRNRTASSGKAIPRRLETKSKQQAIPAAKTSNKVAASSKTSFSNIKEMNPLESVTHSEGVDIDHNLDSHIVDAGVQGGDQDELYDGSTSLTDVIEEVVIQGPELEETTTSQTSEEQGDEVSVDDCEAWERTHKELAQRAEEVVNRMLGQPSADVSGRGRMSSTGAGLRCEEMNGWPQDHEQERTKGKKQRKNTVTFQMGSPPQKEASCGAGRTQVDSPEQLEGKVRAPPVLPACIYVN